VFLKAHRPPCILQGHRDFHLALCHRPKRISDRARRAAADGEQELIADIATVEAGPQSSPNAATVAIVCANSC
jgi:hypothetical protein